MKNLVVAKKLALVSFLLIGLLGSSTAFARSISISPLNFRFDDDPGEIVEETVVIMNSSFDEEAEVEMLAEQMEPRGEEGGVSLIETQDVDEETLEVLSIEHWIDFEPAQFTLDPREEKEVDFRINVPENATPGGHYVGIIAGTPQDSQVEGGGVGITHRVASTALLTVSGEMEERVSAVSLETDSGYYEYGPVTFSSRFKNEGTVHIRPEAEITITDLRGEKVDKIDVEEATVLPGATRRVETVWDVDTLWGGRYTATLSGVYGEDGQSLGQVETTFYAFPWKYGLVGLLVIVFFILTRKRWITILKILVKGEAALKEGE